jgi:hypothetical protein
VRKGFVSLFTSYLAVLGSRLCDGFNPFDYDSVHR